jgi:hypothetical protein
MEKILDQENNQNNKLYNLLSKNHTPDNTPKNSFQQLLTFPVKEIALKPEEFIKAVGQIYKTEKEKYNFGNASTIFDIGYFGAIERLDFHIKVHTTTGLAHWGSSTTESIPYWDRQALHEAIKQNNTDYEPEIEAKDIGNINCLRVYLQILIPKYNETKNAMNILDQKLITRQQTHRDLSGEFQLRYNAWQVIMNDYDRVIKAKFKHIIYLTDKLNNAESRKIVYKEITEGLKRSNLSVDDIAINLGIDGGLSEETYRPAYIIKDYAQLNYLNQDKFSIPQEICPTWDFNLCSQSILRKTGDESLLLEPAEYNLPWKFNK